MYVEKSFTRLPNARRKIRSFAYTMQETPNLDKALPIKSSVIHSKCETVHLSDQQKPLYSGPFQFNNKATGVTVELLTQDGKTFHTHKNLFIPNHSKESLLFFTSNPSLTKNPYHFMILLRQTCF